MSTSPEELALELSRASVHAQEQSEAHLRERATALLAATSIVVPVAAIEIGHGPALIAIPFAVAAIAYTWCVKECGTVLLPRGVHVGLLGGELLDAARRDDAELLQMQAAAASYLDAGYRRNQEMLSSASDCVRRAVLALTVEMSALTVALFGTLLH